MLNDSDIAALRKVINDGVKEYEVFKAGKEALTALDAIRQAVSDMGRFVNDLRQQEADLVAAHEAIKVSNAELLKKAGNDLRAVREAAQKAREDGAAEAKKIIADAKADADEIVEKATDDADQIVGAINQDIAALEDQKARLAADVDNLQARQSKASEELQRTEAALAAARAKAKSMLDE